MAEVELFRNLRDLPKIDYYTSGHRTCAGCGSALTYRMVAKASGPQTVLLGPTGCMYVANGHQYLTSPYAVPWYHTQLGSGGAAALGTSAAFRALMRKGKRKAEKINVIVMGGDGGTSDMGFGALSMAMSYDYDLLYVLYDNESYANTGIQDSSLTPWGAWTTFTPSGKVNTIGNKRQKKNIAKMVAEHPAVKYVATATPAYAIDLINKLRKGLAVEGPAFVHILAPCPKGWRFDPNETIKISRLAIQTGMWVQHEVIDGKFKLTYKPKNRKPVEEYLRLQGRFDHLTEKEIQIIQDRVNEMWEKIEG